ncbi:hypothetical protein WJR50_31100 [Catalinimonas sp. 4WD22]|uniref:hypothetical protein n=1 Tax=Catalinimonas locisalis TaxID=3133978 RepID=UPI003100D146
MTRYFIILLIGFFLFSCGEEEGTTPQPDEPSEQEKTADKLEGSWTLSEVQQKPENIDVAQLQGFQLSFDVNAQKTGGAFQASSTSGLIGPEGQWAFVGTSITDINLTAHSGSVGTLEISLNGNQLQLNFSTPSEPLSRSQGLDGDYQLLMTK